MTVDGPVEDLDWGIAADESRPKPHIPANVTFGGADVDPDLLAEWKADKEAEIASMPALGPPVEVLRQPDIRQDPDFEEADLSTQEWHAHFAAAEGETNVAPVSPQWLDPPGEAAFHGLAGMVAKAIAPHTEADPIALLATTLAVFGALAGDGRSFYLGQRQRANLYILLVGDSATGRKGTALSNIKDIFTAANCNWDDIVVPGLGSGEGLVGHLQRQAEKDEHRALVIEPEFGRLLRVMARDGSTLSPMLRDGWDGMTMGRTLARESALITRHHVACLGHITPVELRDRLSDVEAANGFGNRFLFIAVKRPRLVAIPRSPSNVVDHDVLAELEATVRWAKTSGEIHFTSTATDRWTDIYRLIQEERVPALVGALTRRAEAQLARLALVYALLDRSSMIDLGHLEAAEAFWSYARQSARYLFSDSTGNRHADLVLRLLRQTGEITREEIKSETGLRLGADLDALESALVDGGLAELISEPRHGGGRPRRKLRLVTNGANGQ